MGLFKAYRDTMKEVHEIDKTWDPGAQRKQGMAKMAQMQEQMAEMTKQANLQATGVTCSATVVALRDTGGMVNMQPIVEIDMTVSRMGSRLTRRRSARRSPRSTCRRSSRARR